MTPRDLRAAGSDPKLLADLLDRAATGAAAGSESALEAVELRDVQQLAYTEVARRLGIKLNTAKSRVARGRALVASRLARR